MATSTAAMASIVKGLLYLALLFWSCLVQPADCGNSDAKRLYDDLLSNYNKIVRPVVNNSDVLTVHIKLKLSQLIDLVSDTFFPSFFQAGPSFPVIN